MALGYYLWRGLAYLISRLPFPLLYVKSDVLRILLYDILRYRRRVVMKNLERSFPSLSRDDRKQIARRFYRNLSDIILEVIKTEGMKAEQLKSRFQFPNIHILSELGKAGKPILIGVGHCGNWEWGGPALLMHADLDGYAIVKPLNDKRFNNYMELLRAQFFTGRTIPFKLTLRHLLGMKDQAVLAVLAADQTPTRQESRFWTTFLNQETPFFEGIGKMAHSMGLAVVFLDFQREKRGHYIGHFTVITEDGSKTNPERIILDYVNLLESIIQQNPDNWLWSHRRWKHQRQDEVLHPRQG